MSSEYTTRVVLLVPAALVPVANEWLAGRLGEEAAATFGAPSLAAAEAGPATHSWCSWQVTDEQLVALKEMCDVPAMGEVLLLAADEVDAGEVLAMTGLVRLAQRGLIG